MKIDYFICLVDNGYVLVFKGYGKVPIFLGSVKLWVNDEMKIFVS